MSEYYDHTLHNQYQDKINNEINIRIKLCESLELFKKLQLDTSEYPSDQESLYEQHFPLINSRSVPELTMSDYIMALHNYRTNGYLYTIRFINPQNTYSEVIFLDPNDNGQVWLFIIGSELGNIEEIKKYSNINLTTNLVEGVFY